MRLTRTQEETIQQTIAVAGTFERLVPSMGITTNKYQFDSRQEQKYLSAWLEPPMEPALLLTQKVRGLMGFFLRG